MTLAFHRLHACALLLATLALGGACAQPHSPSRPSVRRDAARELTALQDAWGAALVRRDTTFFSRVLADDFFSGTATKASVMASVRSAARDSLERADVTDVRVRELGEIALVTALITYTRRRAGQAFTDRNRYLRVFVWRDERWQAVAGQATPVGPQ